MYVVVRPTCIDIGIKFSSEVFVGQRTSQALMTYSIGEWIRATYGMAKGKNSVEHFRNSLMHMHLILLPFHYGYQLIDRLQSV